MAFLEWTSGRIFNLVHRNNLVYNTCWEDPRLDRVALDLGPDDSVVVITSAGCNALDYALTAPHAVHAVDMNPRQNALLELKLAGIRELEFDDFFRMFGEGRFQGVREVYADKLRGHLNSWSKNFWDKRIKFFDNRRKPFYFRGTSGAFARLVNIYADWVVKLRPEINELLDAPTLEEQQDIYFNRIRAKLWTKTLRTALNRDTTWSMVGVPRAQRRQVESQYQGGIVKFVEDCMDAVFGELPLSDNYFWRVYITGTYTRSCCPEYLKEDNFERLKSELADRVHVHTDSVQGFLEKHDEPITRFVLLDHMDWLSDRFFPLLEAEWQAIANRASENARIIWRSGGLRTDFIDRVNIEVNGEIRNVSEMLTYHPQLAEELHAKDRVHTYGSFYIADFAAA